MSGCVKYEITNQIFQSEYLKNELKRTRMKMIGIMKLLNLTVENHKFNHIKFSDFVSFNR